MSRPIDISTDVFAAIWAKRMDGEESENAILRRLLGCSAAEGPEEERGPPDGGVYDTRNKVQFPRGFVIFRNYKQSRYEAIAENGSWRRTDTGKLYPTLNQLNCSIAAGPENVWNGNWKYKAENGTVCPIGQLRNQG